MFNKTEFAGHSLSEFVSIQLLSAIMAVAGDDLLPEFMPRRLSPKGRQSEIGCISATLSFAVLLDNYSKYYSDLNSTMVDSEIDEYIISNIPAGIKNMIKWCSDELNKKSRSADDIIDTIWAVKTFASQSFKDRAALSFKVLIQIEELYSAFPPDNLTSGQLSRLVIALSKQGWNDEVYNDYLPRAALELSERIGGSGLIVKHPTMHIPASARIQAQSILALLSAWQHINIDSVYDGAFALFSKFYNMAVLPDKKAFGLYNGQQQPVSTAALSVTADMLDEVTNWLADGKKRTHSKVLPHHTAVKCPLNSSSMHIRTK